MADEANDLPACKYWAFISYSHSDKRLGDWLIRALETYRVPKRLVGTVGRDGPVPARAFPIFRDRDELPGASDLTENIRHGLEQSRYLIVLCSPRSAASRWVGEEIMAFKRLGREDRILPVIVSGEPNASEDGGKPGFETKDECFPRALRYRLGPGGELSDQRTEPVAPDLRPGMDGRHNAFLKLLAGILGVEYDALRQRDQERRLRRQRLIIGLALALVSVLSALTIYSVVQRRRAEDALAQGDKLVEFMLNELETGHLDAGGNQDVLKKINEQVVNYYRALPAEAQKAKGDRQRRFATLFKAKSSLLQGDIPEAEKTMQSLAPQATAKAADDDGETDMMLQFSKEIMQIAAAASQGHFQEKKLRDEIEALRKKPVEPGKKFGMHMALATKLIVLSAAATGQDAENVAQEAVEVAERMEEDFADDQRVQAAAKKSSPPPTSALATGSQLCKIFPCMAYKALGDARRGNDKPDAALEAYRKAMPLLRVLRDSATLGSFAQYLQADVQSGIGSALEDQGKRDEAAATYQAGVDELEPLIARDGSNMLWRAAQADLREKVASLQEESGKQEEALATQRKVLEARLHLRKTNPAVTFYQRDTANSYFNVGNLLYGLGRFHEAEENLREAVDGQQHYLETMPTDVDNRRMLGSYRQLLGNALERQGEREKARASFRDAADLWRKLAAESPGNDKNAESLTVCLGCIAVTFYQEGRFEDALANFEQTLALRQKNVPGDQPATAGNLTDVGNCLFSLGRFQDALPRYEESLAMRQRLAADGPDKVVSLENLALCLQSLGRFQDALPRHQEALAMGRRIFQGDRVDAAGVLNNLAFCLQSLGRLPESLPVYEEALAMRRRLFKTDHADLAQSLNNLAFCLQSLGRYQGALPLHEETLAMRRNLFKGDRADIAVSLYAAAVCRYQLGREQAALPAFEEALAMRRRLFAKDHLDLANSLGSLAVCLDYLDRAAEALPLAEESVAMLDRLFPGDHAERAATLKDLGSILYDLSRYDEARSRFEAALAMRRRLFPGNHADVASSLFAVGNCDHATGRAEQALASYRDAQEMLGHLGKRQEVFIRRTEPGGPAERLGLRAEDVVTQYGSEPIFTRGQLASLVRRAKGQDIELKVRRGDETLVFKAGEGKLGAVIATRTVALTPPAANPPDTAAR